MTAVRLAVVLSLLVTAQVWGQTGYETERDLAEPRVQWDFSLFGPPPEGPFQLEVYYKIFNDGLTYRKYNGHYMAAYRLEILVYQDGEQAAGTTFEEEYTVESFPRTLSQTDFLINQINLALAEPGSYDLVLRLQDLKSGQTSESRHDVKIPNRTKGWSMSGLEFARHIEPARDTSQFNKGRWLVVPSVSRSYGGKAQLTCPLYAEIYGAADGAGTPLFLRLTASGELGRLVLDTTISLESRGRVTPLVTQLRVEGLTPGGYQMKIELAAGDEDDVQFDREDHFDITWSLSTLLRTDYKAAVEQLKFIASDEERDSLLEAPDSTRTELWQAFWNRRDPTPGTPLNEFRDEYYRRIRYTNASFSVINRPGWRTDRGMIYIQYGEPDEVERHPFDMDGRPYNAPWQVWYYYSSALRFVFVDRRSSGEYELQYPYDGDPWRHY